MGRKPKQRRSILLKIFMLAACVYIVASLSGQWSKLDQSQAERDALLLKAEQLKQSIKDNKNMLKDESNTLIIEKAARERLGYIYSDEQVFVDISGN